MDTTRPTFGRLVIFTGPTEPPQTFEIESESSSTEAAAESEIALNRRPHQQKKTAGGHIQLNSGNFSTARTLQSFRDGEKNF